MKLDKVAWLRIETRIRYALRDARDGKISEKRALIQISDIIGEETWRGYELPLGWGNDNG